ncbi:MAG: hypothetical protein U0457_01685 [Candidatus Sericytochromatia bacterium]
MCVKGLKSFELSNKINFEPSKKLKNTAQLDNNTTKSNLQNSDSSKVLKINQEPLKNSPNEQKLSFNPAEIPTKKVDLKGIVINDYDGIDTDSKNDTIFSIKSGNISIDYQKLQEKIVKSTNEEFPKIIKKLVLSLDSLKSVIGEEKLNSLSEYISSNIKINSNFEAKPPSGYKLSINTQGANNIASVDMICKNDGIYLSVAINPEISKFLTTMALTALSPTVGIIDYISDKLTGYSLSNYFNNNYVSPFISSQINSYLPNELKKEGLSCAYENGMAKLVPNFQNNLEGKVRDEKLVPILESFPISNFEKLYVENASAKNLNFNVSQNGDLNLSFSELNGIASSNPYGNVVKKEKTMDIITAEQLTLNNDGKQIVSDVDKLKAFVEIDETETQAFSTKLTQLYGKGKNIVTQGSMQLEIDGKVITDGNKIQIAKGTKTDFKARNINFSYDNFRVSLNSTDGLVNLNSENNLNTKGEFDKIKNIAINGAFQGGIGTENVNATFNDLRINSNVSIKSDKDSVTASFNQGNIYAKSLSLSKNGLSSINLSDLNARNISLNVDIAKNNNSVSSVELANLSKTSANIDNLTVGNELAYKGEINNGKIKYDQNGSVHFSGNNNVDYLGINFNNLGFALNNANVNGKINYDATKSIFSFDGIMNFNNQNSALKLGQTLDIKGSFSGSIDYNKNNKDLAINGKVKNLQGKIGNFNIADIDSSGLLELKNNTLSFANVDNFNLSLKEGSSKNSFIAVNGNDFSVSKDDSNNYVIIGKDKKGDKDDSKISLNLKNNGIINTIAKNLVFTGNIKYDPESEIVSFGEDKKSDFTIKKGNILGVELTNFNPNGVIDLDQKSNSFEIKSPMSFTGLLTKNNISIRNGELNAIGNKNSSIKFDNSQNTINFDGNVSFELKTGESKKESIVKGKKQVSNEEIFNRINLVGKSEIKQEGNKYIINSPEGSTINTEINGIKLENLKFKGKIILDSSDPNNIKINFEATDNNTPFNIAGKVNGKDIDLNTTGKINISKNKNNETELSVENTKLEGKVSDLSLFTTDKELNGKIIIGNDIRIENMTYGIDVEGARFISSSSSLNSVQNGYEIKLDGELSVSKEKLSNLLNKVSNSSLVKTPEQKNNLSTLSKYFSNMSLENVKIKDSIITLDKDMNFNSEFSIESGEIKINTPKENSIVLNSQAPNDIKTKFDSKGNFSIISNKATFNASINGIEFNNLKLNGSLNFYNGTDESKNQILTISPNNNEPIEVTGDMSIRNSNNQNEKITKNISLKASSEIKLEKTGNNIVASSDKLNIDGMFGDYNIKSNNNIYQKGEITLNEDKSIDISKFPSDFDVEGINFSNASMKISSANSDKTLQTEQKPYFYELNISGNATSNIDKFVLFLGKISNDQLTPQTTKDSIKQTIDKLQKYLKQGDIKSDYNILMGLDKNFNIQTFKILNKTQLQNAEVNLESLNVSSPLKLDKVDIISTSELSPAQNNNSSKMYLKEGEISFNLDENLRNQMGNAVKEAIVNGILEQAKSTNDESKSNPILKNLTAEDFKDFNINVLPNGNFELAGNIKGIPIIKGINIQAHTSIENTLLNIEIDKVKLNGIIGGITQFLLSPFINAKELTAETIEKEALKKGTQVYYSGKNKFSIDLNNIVRTSSNGNLSLDGVNISDGKVKIKYKGEYSQDREFDTDKIMSFTNKFNDYFNNKNSKIKDQDIINFINQDMSNLSKYELTLALDKLSFSDLTLKKLEKKGFSLFIEKILQNPSPRSEEIVLNIINKAVPSNKNDYLKDLKKELEKNNINNESILKIINSRLGK